MWSFSYTKCKRIVCRTKIYFTQHQHIVKRVHHLKKNQQTIDKITKYSQTERKHTHTQPNNLHIERAQANLTNTHILATHREFMNLHTNRETVNFYSKLYSTTHHEQTNLHLRSLCIWKKENTKSNQVISKNVFLYKQHTHTTKYEYYTEFFRRACSSANRKKGQISNPDRLFV